MKFWKSVRRLLPSLRWVALFIFVFGLGFIFALLSGPQTGVFLTSGALAIHQMFSKSATGNWFPDRFERSGVLRHDAARAQAGYTLYTVAPDLSAHLIDMDGHEVHKWFVPQELAIPGAAHSFRTFFGMLEPQIEGGYLYPNGDIILVYEVKALDFPATPLVKLDKDSHIVWRSQIQSHHAIQVVDDKIYALTGAVIKPEVKPGERPNLPPTAFGGEHVSVLNSEGKALHSHAIRDAIENAKNMRIFDEVLAGPPVDAIHSNSLDVLTEKNAHFIPGAKPGNVLLSLRNLDMLAVMDLEHDTIVWALRGSWRKQHDAKMLPNGHILLFDNEGGLMAYGRSRVLEIDPATAGIVWSYDGKDGDPLSSGDNRGGAQRLSGGNTLIDESNAGRILEVTPDGSVAWEFVNPTQADEHGRKLIASLGLTVTRYDPSYLTFLNGDKSHEATR